MDGTDGMDDIPSLMGMYLSQDGLRDAHSVNPLVSIHSECRPWGRQGRDTVSQSHAQTLSELLRG